MRRQTAPFFHSEHVLPQLQLFTKPSRSQALSNPRALRSPDVQQTIRITARGAFIIWPARIGAIPDQTSLRTRLQ